MRYDGLGQSIARLLVRRGLVVFATIMALMMPRIGKPGSTVNAKPAKGVLAMLGPSRPRRRFPSVRTVPPLPSQTPDDEQQTVEALRRIARVVRVAGHEAQKRVGFSAAQLAVLRALDAGRMSVNDLARRTMTNASSVSEVVARLVNQGLVSRSRSLRDARSVELSLTEAGSAALANTLGPEDELRDGIHQMPPHERRQLSRLLRTLLEKIVGPRSTAEGAIDSANGNGHDDSADAVSLSDLPTHSALS